MSNSISDLPGELFTRGCTQDNLHEICLKFPGQEAAKLLRFLRSCDGDVGKASKKIETHLSWQIDNLPTSDENLAPCQKEKYCICAGKDLQDRPIVVYRGNKHDKPPTTEQLEAAFISTITSALDQCKATGDCRQQCTFILFCTKGTPHNIGTIKHLSHTLQANFPEVVHKVLIFPTSFATNLIWSTVKFFFDSHTRNKVVMLPGGRKPPGLSEFIASEHALKEFGGSLELAC